MSQVRENIDALENPLGDDLHKQMYIGARLSDGSVVTDYSLLRTNGVAEKVYSDKSSQKPYTWLGKVLTIAIEQIGGKSIGGAARQEYMRSGGSVTIPKEVLDIPMVDASSMLLEIHRTVWKNLIRKQDVLCKYCGQKMVIDIDLNRIKFLDEDLEKLKTDWQEITIKLPYGYTYEAPTVMGSNTKPNAEFDGIKFNRMVFRIPTLGDAIRNEKYFTDNITFWRRIAYDCLISIDKVEVDKEGKTIGSITTLPDSAKLTMGMRLFDVYLDGQDLEAIRTGLRDEPPSLPFHYIEECANSMCRMETPIAIEQSSFFSV